MPSETTNIETLAYVVHAPNTPFTLQKILLTSLHPSELLIQMQYSGICATDLAFQKGKITLCPYPAIFGHEGAGTILSIGSAVKDKSLKVGDPVLLSMNFCEVCKFCRGGHPADCTEATRLHMFGVRADGSTAARLKEGGESCRFHFFGQSSFAKQSFVHETCVVRVPEGIEDEELPFLAAMGCGYQTGAGTIHNILRPKPTESILILGLGAVGLSALMAAKAAQCQQIIAVDILRSKLQLATELGATHTLNSSSLAPADLVSQIKSLTPSSLGVDFIVECTGSPALIETMFDMLSMRGTACQVGVTPSGSKVRIDPMDFLLGSKSYKGVREGDSNPKEYIPRLCEMWKQGEFPVEKLCKVYDYRDLEVALREMQEGRVTKPVIRW